MIKLIDVTYYAHRDYNKSEQVLEKHQLVTRYAELLKNKMQVLFVKHAGFDGTHRQNGITYQFFTGLNKFWYIPFRTNRFISNQHPDIVLVQGLGFPLQTIALKLQCGKQCKIIVQHHGELPLSGFKLWCQKFAGKFIAGYLFTAEGNARAWRQKEVIDSRRHRLLEVLEASTDFLPLDKVESRQKLGIAKTDKVFLWVGRLNANKNPLSVLGAFGKYLPLQPAARLYMIYQTDDMLAEINDLLGKDALLKSAVHLVGSVPHETLPAWFSAADYYLSGSYKEGSGYALLEAMACGCIPIVTDIPSFQKITAKGKHGYLYTPGDCNDLYRVLSSLEKSPKITSADVIHQFQHHLSFKGIAHDMYWVCKQLTGRI